MTKNRPTANFKNVAECARPRTLERKKRKLSFLVLTVGSLLLSGCAAKAPEREIPPQLADRIRQAMAEQQEVDIEALQAFLADERPNRKEANARLDELLRKSQELHESIRLLSVQAIREAGLDPLRYELDSTNLRPRLRTLGERDRLVVPKWMAEQIRPLLDQRANEGGRRNERSHDMARRASQQALLPKGD